LACPEDTARREVGLSWCCGVYVSALMGSRVVS
jgi:hypothetical protein